MVSACDSNSNPEVTQERKDVHYATHHEIRLLCEPASSGIESFVRFNSQGQEVKPVMPPRIFLPQTAPSLPLSMRRRPRSSKVTRSSCNNDMQLDGDEQAKVEPEEQMHFHVIAGMRPQT